MTPKEIRVLRATLGRTQAGMATVVGTTSITWGRWERGESIPLPVYQERLKRISEIVDFAGFFFKDKLEYQKGLLKWGEMSDKEIKEALSKLEKIISKIKIEDWNKENLEIQIMPEAERAGDRGYLLWPFRVALTGKEYSAPPFEIAEILGKEKTLKRVKEAKSKVK